jgi:hypothetical protein
MKPFLHLVHEKPIAQGTARLVFAVPDNPGLIIKVIRPELINRRKDKGRAWYKSKRRHDHYSTYIREIGEYVAMYARYGKSLPFLQKVVGFAETDLGLGLIFEAILDASGNLAPSLSDLLAQNRYTPEVSDALEYFITQILDSDVILADLHPANIVYSEKSPLGPHFVMIDGIGLYTLLPFKALSKRLNQRSKLKHIARLRSRMVSWLPTRMVNP